MNETMERFGLLYPKVAQFILDLPCQSETFLFERMSNVEYPFWAEFEYFLSDIENRLGNTQEILRKLSSKAPLSCDRGWECWQAFRSAQFEVTAISLIERYFGGKAIQIVPQGSSPTPDFEVQLNQGIFMVEAKAQSGQQHGDKHPRHDGPILFDPKDEFDLRSWLFERRISSRDGKAMEPRVIAAEKKGTDILICQTDYVATKGDLLSQISVLCPENIILEKVNLESPYGEPIDATFCQVTFPSPRHLTKLKEIWLCYLSGSRYKLGVLYGEDTILMNHLRMQR